MSAVELRLFDVARCRRRHALRARPFQRDAASLVLDHPSVLEVQHARATQSVNPVLALIALQRVLTLRHHPEAHVTHARSCGNLHSIRCCCRYPCRRNSTGILFTIRVLIYSVPQSTLVSARAVSRFRFSKYNIVR